MVVKGSGIGGLAPADGHTMSCHWDLSGRGARPEYVEQPRRPGQQAVAREGGPLTMMRRLVHTDHNPAGGDEQRGDQEHDEEERGAADAAGGAARKQ